MPEVRAQSRKNNGKDSDLSRGRMLEMRRMPAQWRAIRVCRVHTLPPRLTAHGCRPADVQASTMAADSPKDAEYMFKVGHAYLQSKDRADVQKGKTWLREAADMGHVCAAATLGHTAYTEMETLRAQAHVHDYQAAAEAERWLKQASDQGDVQSTRTLVPLYVARGDLASACLMTLTWVRRLATSRWSC